MERLDIPSKAVCPLDSRLLLYNVVLFAFVVIGLIVKKMREKSSRTWKEFILDSSKQMVGASWLHVLNIVFSFALHHLGGDECSWYWIHITVDTTLGVLVNYQLHYLIYRVIVPKYCSPTMAADFKSGDYGLLAGKVQWGKYFRQLFVWLFIVSVMKCTMVLIMLVGHVPLIAIATWVLSPFRKNAELKLMIVMVITPLIMNMVQFWITDSFTKKKPVATAESKPQKHPDANPDSVAYEEVPLTRADDEETEEDMSEFPVSPFSVIFNNPEADHRPRGLEVVELEKVRKKPAEPVAIGAQNGDSL